MKASTFRVQRRFGFIVGLEDYQGDLEVYVVVILFGRAFRLRHMVFNHYTRTRRWPKPFDFRLLSSRK